MREINNLDSLLYEDLKIIQKFIWTCIYLIIIVGHLYIHIHARTHTHTHTVDLKVCNQVSFRLIPFGDHSDNLAYCTARS